MSMAQRLNHFSTSHSIRIAQCPRMFRPSLPSLSRSPLDLQRVVIDRRFSRVAAETDTPSVEGAPVDVVEKEWIALIANAQFMLNDVQNESLAEQLRERVRLFGDKGMEIDFFLVPEPVWLDKNYPDKAKLVGRPCVALVSTDSVWMRFMKTRLDQVLQINLVGISKEEALEAGGDVPDFEKPTIWRAPYSPYSPGWWRVFYPKTKTDTENNDS